MRVILICIAFLIVGLPLQGQTQTAAPTKFSLEQARQYALENSPVLKNSARDVEIAKKKVWETTAIGLPQATLDGTYAYNPQLSSFTEALKNFPGFEDVDPNDFKTNFFANITVSQLIFSGQYLVGLKASSVYKGLSELANTKSEIGVQESITTTYFTALIARESKTILDSTLNTVQKTLYQTQQLLANGFVESTDVDQLKLIESNIKSSLSVTIRQIDLMDRLLKFQMGIPIHENIELTDAIDPLVDNLHMKAGEIDSFNIEKNIDYRLASIQEKLANLNMKSQKSIFLPTLAGFYQRYEDFDDNFFNDQPINTFGLTLSFPLFSSGQRLSQLSQRKVEFMKARTNTQMASESLFIQFETSRSEYLSARDLYIMQKESRDLAFRIYQRTLKKFAEGVGSSLDLNQSQSQYFDAEGKYFSALMSLVTAKSKLESLLAQ